MDKPSTPHGNRRHPDAGTRNLRAHNVRTPSWSGNGPVGTVTRGTTGINRLRRCDRWVVHNADLRRALLHADKPLAVDVGYGASWTTTCEWAARLRTIRPTIDVTGLEIDPERVLPDRDGVHFALGGFELAGLRPHLVRAFNVLRQYDVADVHAAWDTMQSRLAPGGRIIEGTCDELGRRCSWILLDADGPHTLTLAWDPFDVEKPSDLAERLPKVLIHRNIPGDAVHDLFMTLDDAWNRTAPFDVYGPRVRWREALSYLHRSGFPVDAPRRRIRDNVITVPWDVVAEG